MVNVMGHTIEPSTATIRKWSRCLLIPGLIVLASFTFVRYVEWTFAYSATRALSSRTQEAHLALISAGVFFCAFIVLEIMLALLFASYWEYPDFGSTWLRFCGRYGLGLLVALFSTGIVVGLWL